MKNVIFDLDGTLADTSADLIAAANATFEELGHGALLDPVADMRTAFLGGRAMLRLGLERVGQVSEPLIDTYFPVFIDHYTNHIDTHTTLYPGTVEMLEALAARGYALGICTNKPAGLADTLMESLGVRHHFGALLGADSLPVRKPDARHLLQTIADVGGSTQRSALIGDTQTDRDAAKNAGVPSILVTFGPGGEKVKELQPEATIDHFNALPDLIDQMIS